MEEPRFTVGDYLRGTWRIMASLPGPGVTAFALITGLALALDFSPVDVGILPVALAITFATYLVTLALLRRLGLLRVPKEPGRVVSYVGASLLIGLGVIIGFICLLLPGVYLEARWSIAIPMIIAEGARATEAMYVSGERTRASVWALTCAYAIALVPGAINVGLIYLTEHQMINLPPVPTIFAFEILASITMTATWYLDVAAYAMLLPADPTE